MHRESKSFLSKYINNTSPTGYEATGQKIWLDYLRPYIDDSLTDTYGTAVAVINPKAKYKVVIEGHADEISWYVNYISDNPDQLHNSGQALAAQALIASYPCGGED